MPLAMAAGRLTARSDADLIQASKRGDLSAFEEIYAAHAGRMKSIAFHLLADRADAEDAVQEAFLKIYKAAGAIQFDSGLGPWIYRILLNCCYDTGRKRKRQAESPLSSFTRPDMNISRNSSQRKSHWRPGEESRKIARKPASSRRISHWKDQKS